MDRSDISVTAPGDVCAPQGFLAAGIHCGVKRKRRDLALLVSEPPDAAVAAVFTTNKVRAAPVRYCQEVVTGGRAQAIVVNSGNANACTGEQGMADAREMADLTGRCLSVDPGRVLVASTGVIGVYLPMDSIREGIPRAVEELQPSGDTAARAILTTDRFTKTTTARLQVGGETVTVGGMAKGAGMIHPRLATTLGFLTTDARVAPDVLSTVLQSAVDRSFNRITVDGETSTNDAVFLLANGASGVEVTGGDDLARFTEAVTAVAESLARMVPRDGEGATRLIEVRVQGARNDAEALRGAERVANSLLVKTALRGGDPNWGRALAAVGAADIDVEEDRVDLWLGEAQVARGGVAVPENLEAARQHLEQETVELRIDLGLENGAASVWTCDLGEEYIQINVQRG